MSLRCCCSQAQAHYYHHLQRRAVWYPTLSCSMMSDSSAGPTPAPQPGNLSVEGPHRHRLLLSFTQSGLEDREELPACLSASVAVGWLQPACPMPASTPDPSTATADHGSRGLGKSLAEKESGEACPELRAQGHARRQAAASAALSAPTMRIWATSVLTGCSTGIGGLKGRMRRS